MAVVVDANCIEPDAISIRRTSRGHENQVRFNRLVLAFMLKQHRFVDDGRSSRLQVERDAALLKNLAQALGEILVHRG